MEPVMGTTEIALMIGIAAVSIIVPLVITAIVIFFVIKMVKGLGDAKSAESKLLQTGLPAQAIIKQVGQSGMTVTTFGKRAVQMQYVVEVRLENGQSPYPVNISPLVPEIVLHQLSPGKEIPVKVDPNNPNIIAIDYGAMGYMI